MYLAFGGVLSVGFPLGLGVVEVVLGVDVLGGVVEVGPVGGADGGLPVSLAGPLALPLGPGNRGTVGSVWVNPRHLTKNDGWAPWPQYA